MSAAAAQPAARAPAGVRAGRLSGWAWATIALAAAFVAISCWWLQRDHAMPFADGAAQLYRALVYREALSSGELGRLWTHGGLPPLTILLGGVAALVRRHVDAPAVAENLVYVPLLALGCYGTGRLLAGPRAGFLAALFALGAPLAIEQLHLFSLGAATAALAAVSIWLILASDRFARVGLAACAGVAVGAGLLADARFAVYVAGLLALVLIRGQGWRNARGIAAFAGVALLLAGAWYVPRMIAHVVPEAGELTMPGAPGGTHPALLSLSNAGWYLWATLNVLLLAPLFAFAVAGVGLSARSALRSRSHRAAASTSYAPELLGGLVVGWLGLTLLAHHDVRYTLGLLPYLAVLGTAWIASLAPAPRALATTLLALAVLATTLGASFGLGGEARVVLAGHHGAPDRGAGRPAAGEVVLFADRGLRVGAPQHDGADVFAIIQALRRTGDPNLSLHTAEAPVGDPLYEYLGIIVLAGYADFTLDEPIGLVPRHSDAPPDGLIRQPRYNARAAMHIRIRIPGGPPQPCAELPDGTKLWVLRGLSRAHLVCPTRPGAAGPRAGGPWPAG